MKDFKHRRYMKLTPEQVRAIKDLLKTGINQTQLAKHWGVCRATINRIANNRMWEDVK